VYLWRRHKLNRRPDVVMQHELQNNMTHAMQKTVGHRRIGDRDFVVSPVQVILMVWSFRRKSLNFSFVVSLMDSILTTIALL